MLGTLVTWFKALSIAGKTGVVAATTVVGGTGLAAVSPEPPAQSTQSAQCSSATSQTEEIKVVDYPINEFEDSKLDKGKSEIRTAGVSGENKLTYTVTEYTPTNCQPNTKLLDKEEVIKKTTTQVTAIGTYVAPPPPPAPKPITNCAPGYSPCVPNVSYDLNCPDIGFSVTVTGSDPHGFDRDGDGYGCESY